MDLYCCLVSDFVLSVTNLAWLPMATQIPQGIKFSFASMFVKLQEYNDASLNINSISIVFLLTLYCVQSHDMFSVDPGNKQQ